SSSEILFVCVAGYIAAKYGIITSSAQKGITSLIINILMPCLLFSEVGSDIDISKLISLWPVPTFFGIFAIISALLGFFVGKFLNLSSAKTKFIMTGIMFNNVTSLPLGLLRGIENTSAMELLVKDEVDTPGESIKRGKSYILLAVLFGTLLRWSFGAFLLKKESTNDEEDPLITPSKALPPIHYVRSSSYAATTSSQPDESTQLLRSTKRTLWTETKRLLNKYIKIFRSVMNPPLYAAVISLIVGTVPPLKNVFFGHDAAFSVLSQATEYIGTITIPLTLISLGAQLKNMQCSKGNQILSTIGYIMACRFFIMPIIGVVLVLVTKSWYMQDPMLWFVLMLFASGPTAIGCINLAQLNESFEEEMAALLFYSYVAVPPLLTLIVMSMLTVIGSVNSFIG
ncbi:8805_t:CDS:2, partial [Acaulospora morrowiae]